MEDKEKLTTLDKFTAPIWGQEIELQQVEYLAGGTPMLRLRIREKKRFTIFDIDAQTAARWGKAMQDWANSRTAANDRHPLSLEGGVRKACE